MQTPPPHPDSGAAAWHRARPCPRAAAECTRCAEHLGLDHLLERDFGRDSLARVELLVRIERELGAKLGEKTFVNAETPAPAGAPVFAEVKVYHPPQAASTLIEILDWHVTRHAEQVYRTLYDEEERTEDITYRMLQEQAKALAAGLHQHGLSSGDKVAIMLPTGRGFFAAFYGALYAGCVPVPLYPPARPSQIEDHMRRIAGIIANAQASILVTVDQANPLGHLLPFRLGVFLAAARSGTPLLPVTLIGPFLTACRAVAATPQ